MDYEIEDASYILFSLHKGGRPSRPGVCYNCHTTDTPLWRHHGTLKSTGVEKEFCNACGIRMIRSSSGIYKKTIKPLHKKQKNIMFIVDNDRFKIRRIVE